MVVIRRNAASNFLGNIGLTFRWKRTRTRKMLRTQAHDRYNLMLAYFCCGKTWGRGGVGGGYGIDNSLARRMRRLGDGIVQRTPLAVMHQELQRCLAAQKVHY